MGKGQVLGSITSYLWEWASRGLADLRLFICASNGHPVLCYYLCVIVTGVLGYYLAQLNDMIQYPDLRTEVFQSFREIGNAVLFCLLVEQSLVRNDGSV